MSSREHVKMEALNLQEGETMRIACPECGSLERTLTITRKPSGLVFFCHRASCGWRGAEGSRPDQDATAPAAPKQEPYDLERVVQDEETIKFLREKFGFDVNALGVDRPSGRVVYPTHGRTGLLRGVVLRSYGAKRSPKIIYHTLRRGDDGIAGWCGHTHGTHRVVIVEDIVSAQKIGQFCASMALLGTHLDEQRLAELRDARPDHVQVCLDPDAVGIAARMVRELSLLFPVVEMVRLDNDPKDTDSSELAEIFGRGGSLVGTSIVGRTG